jgi:hypothetical protein
VTARTFADPPLNTIVLRKRGASFLLDGGVNLPVPDDLAGMAESSYTIGFQPHHLSFARQSPMALPVRARVSVTEITGSESFVHLDFAEVRWVMLTSASINTTGRGGGGLPRSQAHDGLRQRAGRSRRPAAGGIGGTAWRASTCRTSGIPTRQSRRRKRFRAEEVDHAFEDGGAYALLGPSGCGKTTLLNIISGLLQPTEGRLLFDGRDVTAPVDPGAQHRPGLPVPGRLRHDDGLRQSRLPPAQSRHSRARSSGWCARRWPSRVWPNSRSAAHTG